MRNVTDPEKSTQRNDTDRSAIVQTEKNIYVELESPQSM